MTDEAVQAALDVARYLVDAGVPLFTAPAAGGRNWEPDRGTGKCGYWLPNRWQDRAAEQTALANWRPGMALCAVMGHTVDGLDVDPRNGGDASTEHLPLPKVWGVQATPSGGWHGLIAPLRTGSRDAVLPGVDIKGGKPDGTGRGFLFIAPTRKLNKVTGEIAAYSWLRAPDLSTVATDDSGTELADLITVLRTPAPVASRGPVTTRVESAPRIIAGLVAVVLRAPSGQRNNALNWAAFKGGLHAAGGILDQGQLEQALTEAGALAGLDDAEIGATLRSARQAAVRGTAA